MKLRWRSKLFLIAFALIGVGALLSVAASRIRGHAPAGTHTAPELFGDGMIVVGVSVAAILVISGFVTNLFLLWRQFSRGG